MNECPSTADLPPADAPVAPRQLSPFSRRRAAHLRLGERGERIAARLLRELGLDVLTRNYRTKRGELDIVARDQGVLCFVEVKTRRRLIHFRPADAVGPAKQRHLISAAKRYIHELGSPLIPYRFDIVEVILDGPRLRDLRYWRHAFQQPGSGRR